MNENQLLITRNAITARLARLWQTADTLVVVNEPFSVLFLSLILRRSLPFHWFSRSAKPGNCHIANLSRSPTFIKWYSKNVFTIPSLFCLFHFYPRCVLLCCKIYLVLSCRYPVIEINILLYILLLKIVHIKIFLWKVAFNCFILECCIYFISVIELYF